MTLEEKNWKGIIFFKKKEKKVCKLKKKKKKMLHCLVKKVTVANHLLLLRIQLGYKVGLLSELSFRFRN